MVLLQGFSKNWSNKIGGVSFTHRCFQRQAVQTALQSLRVETNATFPRTSFQAKNFVTCALFTSCKLRMLAPSPAGILSMAAHHIVPLLKQAKLSPHVFCFELH